MIRPHDLVTYSPAADTARCSCGYPRDCRDRERVVCRSVGPVRFSGSADLLSLHLFRGGLRRGVAGFVVGGLEDTGENIYGHLCNIGVSPRYRGRGIGTLLVRRAEHQFALELATGVQLEVRVSNTGAQRFYQRMGYRPVFGIDQYYANGEDALVMMKWFRF